MARRSISEDWTVAFVALGLCLRDAQWVQGACLLKVTPAGHTVGFRRGTGLIGVVGYPLSDGGCRKHLEAIPRAAWQVPS